MANEGFLSERPRSPGSLAVVIALHGAAIAALMLAKMEYVRVPTVITDAYMVPKEVPPPEPEPVPPQPKQRTVESRMDTPTPVIQPRTFDNVVITDPKPVEPIVFDAAPIGPPVDVQPTPIPTPEPKREPVRTEAQIDNRSKLQPPYPAAEERAEITGSVTVLVTIGTDGRVKAVEKVKAVNDAFFRATQQQALRHWRFKPAMVDGKPVESRKTMTVHFRLNA